MKKIVLIDDNSDGSRHKYGADFVDEGLYKDFLVNIDKINEDSNFEFLDTSVCVLMHKTLRDYIDGEFREDSQKVKEIITKKYPLIGKSIPLVLFSDGDTSDIGDYDQEKNPYEIYSLNKGIFYSRLNDFIQKYIQTKNIDLRILAYGINFETYLVERYASIVFSKLVNIDENLPLSPNLIHCEEMQQLVNISQPKIGKNYNEILVGIQFNNMSVREFKKRINNILDNFQDYGKNNYYWE